MKKMIFVLVVVVMLLSVNMCYVYGIGPKDITIESVTEFNNSGSKLVAVFQVIGNIVSVAVLAYVGIRYMMAAPAEKAQLKGMMIPYIVGAVVVFVAANLAGILYDLAQKIQ